VRSYCWKGCRLTVFCAVLLFSAGCAGSAAGSSDKVLRSAKADFFGLPADILEGLKDTFSANDNVTALLLAGAASIAMHNSDADNKIFAWTERHRLFHSFTDRSLKTIGNPGFHFAAAGIWYGLAVDNDDELNKSRSWTMLKALSTTGVSTAALKAVRNNENPNGKDWAWPSGHTSSSFAAASVLDEFYGQKVGIPAYTVAALVGYRMADSGDHWASDVVFGATLGWVAGRTIAGKDKPFEIAGFKILPFTANNNESAGINLLKRF